MKHLYDQYTKDQQVTKQGTLNRVLGIKLIYKQVITNTKNYIQVRSTGQCKQ